MPRFNHAYDIGFEVAGSTKEDGSDVTPAMLRAALMRRIIDLDESQPDHGEWHEAVGSPFDTHEEDPE